MALDDDDGGMCEAENPLFYLYAYTHKSVCISLTSSFVCRCVYSHNVCSVRARVCLFLCWWWCFSSSSLQWERKNIEGSLFIVKRRRDPRFQIIVLNRMSVDNLVENILGDSFAYELSKPYIMYRNDENIIHGIWFFEERECDVVSNLLTRILATYQPEPVRPGSEGVTQASIPAPVEHQQPLGPEEQGMDIMARLFNGVAVSQQQQQPAASAPSPAPPPGPPPPHVAAARTTDAVNGGAVPPKLLTPAELQQKSSLSMQQHRQAPPEHRQQPQQPKQQPVTISRDQVRALISRLAANEDFIDIMQREMQKIIATDRRG